MRPMEQVVQDGAREIYQVEQSAVVEKPVYQAVKRLFDVVVSALALLILGIPMLLLMPVIRADSPGPAIFRQDHPRSSEARAHSVQHLRSFRFLLRWFRIRFAGR